MAAAHQFGDRSHRIYDRSVLDQFPWPVVAGYDAVHDWMDNGRDVYAAWQLRDVWETTIKFLATIAVADRLTTAQDGQPDSTAVATLLKPQGLSLGDWVAVLRSAAQDSSPAGLFLPELSDLVRRKRRGLLQFMAGGDGVVAWRNRRFGHGVLQAGLDVFAEEAQHWLGRLHELFDDCAELFQRITLESDLPDGAARPWSHVSPLSYYYERASYFSAQLGDARTVRLRVAGRRDALELSPLLTVQKCTVCGAWAAFFMDRYEPDKRRAWFLDFITGHAHRAAPGRLADLAHRAGSGGEPPADAGVPPERREPDPDLFHVFQAEFEPPTHVAEAIAQFMKAKDRGVIYVTGPAGVGKTWLSQGLDHPAMLPKVLRRAVPVLNMSLHRRTAVDASGVMATLGDQALREKRWEVPPLWESPSALQFADWLGEVMQLNNHGELVVALDGWDELADSEGRQVATGMPGAAPPTGAPDLLPPADRLPRGVYIVLTTRAEVKPAVRTAFERVVTAPDFTFHVKIDTAGRSEREVQKAYAIGRLRRRRADGRPLPEAWAEPIVDRAGGRFLYVSHFCRALHHGVVDDETELPAPADYYPLFFAHLRGRVGRELFESYYQKTLALIAAAGWAGLSIRHLESQGLERGRLVAVLADLAELLHAERSPAHPDTFYRLGHSEIRQFLTNEPTWAADVSRARRNLYERTFRESASDWMAVDLADPLVRYVIWDQANLLLSAAIGRVDSGRHKIYSTSPNLPSAAIGKVDPGLTVTKQVAQEILMDPAFAGLCILLSDHDDFRGCPQFLRMPAGVAACQALKFCLGKEETRYNRNNVFVATYLKKKGQVSEDDEYTILGSILSLEPQALELRRLIAMRLALVGVDLSKAGSRDCASVYFTRASDFLADAVVRAAASADVPPPARTRLGEIRDAKFVLAAGVRNDPIQASASWLAFVIEKKYTQMLVDRRYGELIQHATGLIRDLSMVDPDSLFGPEPCLSAIDVALLYRFRAQLARDWHSAVAADRPGAYAVPRNDDAVSSWRTHEGGLDQLRIAVVTWQAMTRGDPDEEAMVESVRCAQQAFLILRQWRSEFSDDVRRKCAELALVLQCAVLADGGIAVRAVEHLERFRDYGGGLIRALRECASKTLLEASDPKIQALHMAAAFTDLNLEEYGEGDGHASTRLPTSSAPIPEILLRMGLVVAAGAHVSRLAGESMARELINQGLAAPK